MNVQELIRVVQEYFPRGIELEDPRYMASPQAQRLQRRLEEARGDKSHWLDFVEHIRDAFPGCEVVDKTLLLHDPCYYLYVSLPGMVLGGRRVDMVACLLSILAPVYVIYASYGEDNPEGREARTFYPPLPAAYRSHEQALARYIEESFGFERLPNETLLVPMPGFRPRTGYFSPEDPAVLADLLFTPFRT